MPIDYVAISCSQNVHEIVKSSEINYSYSHRQTNNQFIFFYKSNRRQLATSTLNISRELLIIAIKFVWRMFINGRFYRRFVQQSVCHKYWVTRNHRQLKWDSNRNVDKYIKIIILSRQWTSLLFPLKCQLYRRTNTIFQCLILHDTQLALSIWHLEMERA